MKADVLRDFLKKFDISKTKIADFFLGKKLIEKGGNYFLLKKEFEENEVFNDSLLFIKLKQLLPSIYLLNFIKDNSKIQVEILKERRALDFTYGKNLNFEGTKITGGRLEEGKNYIVKYDDEILGYVKLNGSNMKNEMNIGEYLRED